MCIVYSGRYLNVKTEYDAPFFAFNNFGNWAIAGNVSSSGSSGVVIGYQTDHYVVDFSGYTVCGVICAGKILRAWKD